MPAIDPFASFGSSLSAPATGLSSVVPDDAEDLSIVTRAIMVATAGNVAVVMRDGSPGLLPALQPGIVYPVRVSRVHATGTTATGIVGLY